MTVAAPFGVSTVIGRKWLRIRGTGLHLLIRFELGYHINLDKQIKIQVAIDERARRIGS